MNETYSQLINRIYNLIQNKDAPTAIYLLSDLISKNKNDINLHHLMGIAHFQLGEIDEAISWLETAVSMGAESPELFNNLGNFYKSNNQLNSSESAYKQAFKLHPSYITPKQSLLNVLWTQKKYSECKKYVELFLSHHSTNPHFHCIRGNLNRHYSCWEEAESSYQNAIKYGTGKNLAVYYNNLGLVYLELCEFEKAKHSFTRSLELDGAKIEPKYNLSTSLYEIGNYDEAQYLLEQIIRSDPSYLLAHKSYNEILFQNNQMSLYGSSYINYINQVGFKEEYAVEYLKCLLKIEDISSAQKLIDSLPKDFSERLKILVADFYDKVGNHELSQSLYDSLIGHTNSPSVVLKYIEYLIRHESYEIAQGMLTKYFDIATTSSQLALAYASIIWKKNQPEKYSWLCDYPSFVREFNLFDFGYSIDELLQLKLYLINLHPNLQEPSDQSVIGGSQIAGKLLNRNSHELLKLRCSLENILHRYVEELPENNAHPFLSRNTRASKIIGSWSVKLRAEGFHKSHIHSEGWVSSAVYIDVPDVGESDMNGALFFGKAPPDLVSKDRSDIIINPKVGSVILFPSYFWHGTEKFLGPDFRITTPFDAVPK